MQADEEYGNAVWDKHFGILNAQLQKQKQLYQWGSVLNPFVAVQQLSMGFFWQRYVTPPSLSALC